MNKVNIAGLDKAAVLFALWSATKTPGLGVLDMINPHKIDLEKCRAALKEDSYVDYLGGRPIHIDFKGDEIDTTTYDKDSNVPGFFAIAAMRQQK